MVNKPKNIGTACETAVVRAAQASGFPAARRQALAGSADRGDIELCPGVIIEVKGGHAAEAASQTQIETWMGQTETERRNAGATAGFLVTKRLGVGPTRAGEWWAHLWVFRWGMLSFTDDVTDRPVGVGRIQLAHALVMLRHLGFGDPLDSDNDEENA